MQPRQHMRQRRLLRSVVFTLCTIALSAIATSLLAAWGAATLTPVIAVAIGLVAAARFGLPGGVPLFATLAAVSGAGIITLAIQPYHLLGGAARADIPVREAASRADLSSFRFSDSAILMRYTGYQEVQTLRGAYLNTVSVAPLVAADWTPGEPIVFWVVADSSSSLAGAGHWGRPYNAGLRLAGYGEAIYAQAVQHALAAHQLPVAPRPIFLRWLADPATELTAARWRAAAVIAGASAGWLLIIAVYLPFQRPAPARVQRGRDPQRREQAG